MAATRPSNASGGVKNRIVKTIGIATAAASSLFSATNSRRSRCVHAAFALRSLARRFAALGLAALVDHAAVPALALLEGEDRLEEVLLAEVGPERRGDPDLAVGDLPEKKVRDAHLPARADEKVRVRQPRRAEPRSE